MTHSETEPGALNRQRVGRKVADGCAQCVISPRAQSLRFQEQEGASDSHLRAAPSSLSRVTILCRTGLAVTHPTSLYVERECLVLSVLMITDPGAVQAYRVAQKLWLMAVLIETTTL